MKIYYLEIVSKDLEASCKWYEELHGLRFGEADNALGGARTARLPTGELLGIRSPLSATEETIVRPYVLTDDIELAVKTAVTLGAEPALAPTPIEGHGICAIVIKDGVQSGLWQV